MHSSIREINGQRVEFRKALQSHLEGNECVYFGSANGVVYLFESDNPDVVLTTTARKWQIFADAVTKGEFQVKN